jgi:hypothetical protein
MKDDVDIDATLAPKSDQLDAIELAEPRTITVTRVTAGTEDQPLNVWFEGDNGRPWRPSKTVRRILRECWGKRGSDWVGKSATLYNDRTVKFGGIEVGGVRVSHASHIQGPIILMLPVTRGKFKKYTVQPLKAPPRAERPPLGLSPPTESDAALDGLLRDMRAASDTDQLAEIVSLFDMDTLTDQQRETAREEFKRLRANLEN